MTWKGVMHRGLCGYFVDFKRRVRGVIPLAVIEAQERTCHNEIRF